MLRKDHLEKQLEQLSLAIAKVISQMSGRATEGKPDSGITIANEFLKTEFDIELAKFAVMDNQHLIEHLTTNKNLQAGKLSLLADLLFETAQLFERSGKQDQAKDLYKKTLTIYYYVNEAEKTFSQVRQERITILKSKI